MHIHLANTVAEQLGRGYVFDHKGAYYLGSTAPDIRAMTRWPREQTHFAPLSVEQVGTGTKTMFSLHPEEVENISPDTQAFMPGFVCLVAPHDV